VDLAEDLDLEVALGNQRLESGVLPLEALEPLGFILGEATVLLAPAIEGLPGSPPGVS